MISASERIFVQSNVVFIGLVIATRILSCRVSKGHDNTLTQTKALIGRLPRPGTKPVLNFCIFIVLLHDHSLGEKTG